MKIKIAFIWSFGNAGIGWWDRKYELYFNSLPDIYFEKYFLYVTNTESICKDIGERVVLLEEQIIPFLQEHAIEFTYFAWARLAPAVYDSISLCHNGLVNVNFTPCYDATGKTINLIISMTDYWKLKRLHKTLHNAYVVYNPINIDGRLALSETAEWKYRSHFSDKKLIVWRIWRAEPSKWHFLIVATLRQLQRKKNYNYGFVFAGMPYLYRKVLKLLLGKKMYESIVFLPELRELWDIATFYKSIDVFRQTSWIGESFGNVIAEAFCFKVPVITDYKEFYRDGRVHAEIYDAQIELVDHEVNGGYCKYPSSCIAFLDAHTLHDVHMLWENGYNKALKEYDSKDTAITLAKILYTIGREKWIYNANPTFDALQQKPSIQQVSKYNQVYFDKISTWKQNNLLSLQDEYIYRFMSSLWRWVEILYLFIRKVLKKYCKITIESF